MNRFGLPALAVFILMVVPLTNAATSPPSIDPPFTAVDTVEVSLPEMNGDKLRSASFRYLSTMVVGGQSVDLEVSRTLEEADRDGRQVWRMVEQLVMPAQFGGMSTVDTFDLDRKTLLPVSRHSESMGTIDMRYSHDRITGMISGAGQELPIDIALDQPVMADGAGLDISIAGMPLEEGYRAGLNFLNPFQHTIGKAVLNVEGTESISVGAGEFEVYRIKINPADGSEGPVHTIHALKEAPHFLIYSKLELPASMGGGTMTSELTWLD